MTSISNGKAHLKPGSVHLGFDKLYQLGLHLLLFLGRIENGVENHDGTLVLQQGHVDHTLEVFEGPILVPVLHDVDTLASAQQLHLGQLRLRGVVEGAEDELPLVGRVAGVQRHVVFARRCEEVGVERLEARDGDATPPATRALKVARFAFGEGAVRTPEQTGLAGVRSCRVDITLRSLDYKRGRLLM